MGPRTPACVEIPRERFTLHRDGVERVSRRRWFPHRGTFPSRPSCSAGNGSVESVAKRRFGGGYCGHAEDARRRTCYYEDLVDP